MVGEIVISLGISGDFIGISWRKKGFGPREGFWIPVADKRIHLAVVSFTTLLRAIVLAKFFSFSCVFLLLFFLPFFLFDSRVFLPPRGTRKLRRNVEKFSVKIVFGDIVIIFKIQSSSFFFHSHELSVGTYLFVGERKRENDCLPRCTSQIGLGNDDNTSIVRGGSRSSNEEDTH